MNDAPKKLTLPRPNPREKLGAKFFVRMTPAFYDVLKGFADENQMDMSECARYLIESGLYLGLTEGLAKVVEGRAKMLEVMREHGN